MTRRNDRTTRRAHAVGKIPMLAVATLVLVSCATTGGAGPADPVSVRAEPPELVVLAHGMGRTAVSMLPLELALERAGFRVLNFGYSSYGPSVAGIGEQLSTELDSELREHPAPRVHFVGHSLGNIVVRWLLERDPPAVEAGRFVILAPPNRGSRMADHLAPLLGWLIPPISELRTSESTAADLPAPEGVDFMIVAGRWDRKVSRDEACLPGAEAFVVVPSGHTLIGWRPSVIDLVRGYLGSGAVPAGRIEPNPCAEV